MNTTQTDTARYLGWCKLIPGYSLMTKTQKKRAKLEYACSRDMRPSDINFDSCVEKVPCPTISTKRLEALMDEMVNPPVVEYKVYRPDYITATIIDEDYEEEEDTTMDYRTSETYMQRDYLMRELRDARTEKYRDSENKFGLRDDNDPKDGAEMVARILAGKYTLQKYDPDFTESDSYIRWRDPAMKQDKEGFDKWIETVDAAFQKAQDEIMVLPPEKGLDSLNTFKAFQ